MDQLNQIEEKQAYVEGYDGLLYFKNFYKNDKLILKETYARGFKFGLYEIKYEYAVNAVNAVDIDYTNRYITDETFDSLKKLIKNDTIHANHANLSQIIDDVLLKQIKERSCGIYRIRCKLINKILHRVNAIIECIIGVNGELIGTYREIFNEIVIIEAHYIDGKLEGPYSEYYINGLRFCEVLYKGHEKNGSYKQYDHNGKLVCEINYDCGVQYGKYIKVCTSNTQNDIQNDIQNDMLIETTKNRQGEFDRVKISFREKKLFVEKILHRKNEIIEIKSLIDNLGRECVLSKGEQIVWKACLTENKTKVYVKLCVPEHARRVTPDILIEYYDSSSYAHKCRIDSAFVVQIIDKDEKEYDVAYSPFQKMKLTYRVGQDVMDCNFNEDPNEIFGRGINVCVYKDHCDSWFSLIDSLSTIN